VNKTKTINVPLKKAIAELRGTFIKALINKISYDRLLKIT